MNPRLVACMLVALMMGVAASGTALALGWSWLIALPLCSLVSSVSLVALAMATLPGEAPAEATDDEADEVAQLA